MKGASVEVAVTTAPAMVDLVVGSLTALGFDGFWEDEGVLRCYIAESLWTPALEIDLQNTLRALFTDRPSPDISLSRLEQHNWNEEWEKSLHPIKVSDRFVISPSWSQYRPAPGETVITIDPKMSFGTGYHESTRIALRLMEHHVRRGDRVLDIGTGTGVLAIAAIALGAAEAVGVDIDEWSIENARENVVTNRAEHISILHGSIDAVPEHSFDLVLANIQRNVIVELLPHIGRRLVKEGAVIFSGLLSTDLPGVIQELRNNGFSSIGTAGENEWSGIVARLHGTE